MSGRRYGEQLVDGLNHHERISHLEKAVDGRRGLVEREGELRARLEQLESESRRRAMPFWLRWMIGAGLKREVIP